MGQPKFVKYFFPVISALQELGGSGRPSEVRDWIAQKLNISEQERTELLKGGAARFDNQVAWARFYLVKAGFLDSSKRGVWSLTDRGRDVKFMSDTEAVSIFKAIHSDFEDREMQKTSVTPSAELIEDTIAPSNTESTNDRSYREKLLEILLSLPPSGFERLCQRLLREAGFEQVIVKGRSGDGGIDGEGILQVNPFVSFKVLFQCKRYNDSSVTSSQIRDFRGAMMGRADKGIIITTGTFTDAAQKEAIRDGAHSIELVNRDKLLDMFESLELGLKPRKTYDVDSQFFQEFQS